MAKRAPANETPYSPLDAELAQSVMDGVPAPAVEKKAAGAAVPKHHAKRSSINHPLTDKQNIVEHPGAKNPVPIDVPNPTKRLSREKRVMLSREEEREIERLVNRIGDDLGTSLKLSHLLRACMVLLCHAENELHGTAAALGPLARPGNGDPIALAQFEFDLAKLLSKALRDALPLR